MNLIQRMTEKFGEIPLFVIFFGVFSIIELAVMWMVVPSTGIEDESQQETVIAALFGEDGLVNTSSDLSLLIADSQAVSSQLNNDPVAWQCPLVVENPCSRFVFKEVTTPIGEQPSQTWMDHQLLVELADRALIDLKLTSIMTGNKGLANISGMIYQQGDTLLLPNADGSFLVKEVTAESVTLDLIIVDVQVRKEYGNIERVLFLANNSARRFVTAEDNE